MKQTLCLQTLQLLSQNTSACSSSACFSWDQFQPNHGLELKTQGHLLTSDGWQFTFLHFYFSSWNSLLAFLHFYISLPEIP